MPQEKLPKTLWDDSKANVVMATANLASAQIAVGAAAAAAAAGTPMVLPLERMASVINKQLQPIRCKVNGRAVIWI